MDLTLYSGMMRLVRLLLNVKEKAKATGKLQAAVYGADGNSGESFTNMVNPSQPKGNESFHNIF